MSYLGHRDVDSTVHITFTTNDGDGGRVEPNSAFEAADVRIYKDGSATQRTGVSGLTMTSPFDSMVGVQHLAIDLSDDDDTGFYAAGSFYEVVLYPDETVDSQDISKVIGTFDIGPQNSNVQQLGGVTQSLTDLKDFADAGYDPATNKVEGVKLVDTTTTNSDMRGTNGANTTVPDAAGTAAALHAVTDALIGALNDLSASDVNAEMVDVIETDTHAEIGQESPAATQTILKMLQYLYKAWRNQKIQDSSSYELYNDAGDTVDQKATDSDDGTDATIGKIVTGP